MNLIQPLMPDGLTHVNYRLRAFRPGVVEYVTRINDFFGENLDRNIIHIFVEPLQKWIVSVTAFEAFFRKIK